MSLYKPKAVYCRVAINGNTVSGNTLQQVEKFKYLGVVFTSDRRRSEEIDTRIGKANAVLRELDGNFMKRQDGNFTKSPRWTNGRTEVRLCSGQETSLAPPYLNLRSFGSICTALKKKLATLLGLFGARKIVPPSLRPWCDTSPQSAQL